MKKSFKIEEAIRKMEGVAGASVNFMTQKMTISFADGADPAVIMPAVAKRAHDIEEDCVIHF